MTTDTPTTTDLFLADSSRRLRATSGLDMPLCLDHNADARELIGVVIAAEAQRIARHESEARLGVDPDGVHQLRVAAAACAAISSSSARWLAPEWVGVMRTETAWVTDSLGRVRDLEVMRDVLSACAASLPAADVGSLEPLFLNLAAQHADARHDMLVMLDDPRFEELLLDARPRRDRSTVRRQGAVQRREDDQDREREVLEATRPRGGRARRRTQRRVVAPRAPSRQTGTFRGRGRGARRRPRGAAVRARDE